MTRLGHGLAGLPDHTDVLVVGLGVTGAGVALDAAARGLHVVAVDAHDVAFGTSRWSSKLVHGGLRYLARMQVGVARESAVERGILMETTAPHLTRAMPMLLPLMSSVSRPQAGIARAGFAAGDLLRRVAGTDVDTLPRPRRISRAEVLTLAPGLRDAGLRGGLLSWDGQLEDDARLVTCLARTAVAEGASVRTRVRVLETTGTGALLRDELTGETRAVTARAVVNATGVWAGDLVDVRLRPSRGTHLVLGAGTLPGLAAAVTVPVPGETNRFVFLLPQSDGRVFVGLTDEPAPGPVPDVPEPTETEIGFLLDVVAAAFDRPLRRSDVVGAYAGLRPLLDVARPDARPDDRPGTRPGGRPGRGTADLSRQHAVLTSGTGPCPVVTVVGGKLTTYRRMAEDAVDATGLGAGRCRTRDLPLLGAAPRAELARLEQPSHLVRRYGTEAAYVLDDARAVTGLSEAELLAPAAPHLPVTLADLVFGVTHEGALDVDDLLDRRTRVGLVSADRELARPLAERALALVHAD
ncbi:glycerol-3-phosphate dehydrogenase/oxidase [Nocardioides donggukensis]|uniref:Glycerol-3-phosphate dehydrogenase/oxidase n=1 Tax=Nocardioides donggukensis TaxID=2774019 RepID=A0A927KB81_9ACTN|nr:glycerol-3-phosphate dehydrogenase/oxidase [Nocardioides donggukensis]MBD8871106.1 glycerol-3-phosphate dehydrogenase/oxidase [Nocardioides donggukensis]